MVLSWYKDRGATEYAHVLVGGGGEPFRIEDLTLAYAERAIEEAERRRFRREQVALAYAEEQARLAVLKRKPRRRHSASGQVECPICRPLRCSKAK